MFFYFLLEIFLTNLEVVLFKSSKKMALNLRNFKSNLSLYLLYFDETYNEFAGPISTSLRPGNVAPTFRRNVAAVASRWQHCVRFNRPEI